MRHSRIFVLATALVTTGFLGYGCGASHVQSGQAPGAPGSAQAAAPKPEGSSSIYVVKKHDTLWDIAGKPLAYGNPFEWPEIFKANRDKVADPDLIYPRQAFRIETGLSGSDLEHAKELAMQTPKYVPHASPRQTLPVDYF